MNKAMEASRRPGVQPVSQILLSFPHDNVPEEFERIQKRVLKFVERRAGGELPPEAHRGESFITDGIQARRTEGISIPKPRYWSVRFDDEDRDIAQRFWVIEATIAEDSKNSQVLFGLRLHCVARANNPPYQRTIPSLARFIVSEGNAHLDGREISCDPWFLDDTGSVEALFDLLEQKNRSADLIAISLPHNTSERTEAVVSATDLAARLTGAAHIVVLSATASQELTNEFGSEFSVFHQGVRTYRPGFDPNIDSPMDHPLTLADSIRNWKGGIGGARGYENFLISQTLEGTVKEKGAFKRLPSFANAKQRALAIRRQHAQEKGSTGKALLAIADDEIENLKSDLNSQKKEYEELLLNAEKERDEAVSEINRLKASLYHTRARLNRATSRQPEEIEIPKSLDSLEDWAEKHLGGSVELHNRAYRHAKQSVFEDAQLVYKALLLLRDFYVPMKQVGGSKKKEYDKKLQELRLEETPCFAGDRAGEEGDNYWIRFGSQKFLLDRHLKQGNTRDPRFCFRLYFCWDDETEQVIVGSLPGHLPTRNT